MLPSCPCATSSTAAPTEPATISPTPDAGEVPEQESSVPNPLPPNVTARGVVLATVIIATGNVASAIEEGLISPEEVNLARKAIAEGTLDQWVEAAEEEKR